MSVRPLEVNCRSREQTRLTGSLCTWSNLRRFTSTHEVTEVVTSFELFN